MNKIEKINYRPYFAEIIGTYFLVFFGTTAVSIAVLFGVLSGILQVGILWGIGLTLGIFVSFICLAVDNLIRTWADERKKLLGLD